MEWDEINWGIVLVITLALMLPLVAIFYYWITSSDHTVDKVINEFKTDKNKEAHDVSKETKLENKNAHINMSEFREKTDTAIGCSGFVFVPLGILVMLCTWNFFSFADFFSDSHNIFAISVLFVAVVFAFLIQHTYFTDKVSNISLKLNEKIKECDDTVSIVKARYERMEYNLKSEYQTNNIELRGIYERKNEELKSKEQRLYELLQSSHPFKILASAYADAVALVFKQSSDYLRYKSHPALTASEEVRRMRNEVKRIANEAKMYQYQYELLLKSMPSVEDDIEDDGSLEIVEDYYKQTADTPDDYDRVQDYISKEDYEKLSVDERNQLALDRYMHSHKKSKWQIGRDYEMYVCHWFRQHGLVVEHTGVKGLEDLGRDIIAHGGNGTDYIIQCKFWSKDKVIREKYIMQLYATTIAYRLENAWAFPPVPVFVTNIELSDTAKKFAQYLKVEVRKLPMGEYPVIKCNINQGSKIYHLPFDQQYDRTQICNPGECFAYTVKEAVEKGFRRAYKYNFKKQ